ncbi:MAG TPA: hypothetical protein VEK08_09705 [Planctomycetota bacterium]|nr:hypothetical protein [Planctomycetota bacterium]
MADNYDMNRRDDAADSSFGWWAWLLALVLLLFAVGFGGWGTNWGTPAPTTETATNSETATGTTAPTAATAPAASTSADQNATADLNARIDQPITLTGRMVESKSPNAFIFAGSDDATSDKMLVIHRTGAGEQPIEVSADDKDATLQISGNVKKFNRADLARELGVDENNEMLAQYENKPVIVADQVKKLGPAEGAMDEAR